MLSDDVGEVAPSQSAPSWLGTLVGAVLVAGAASCCVAPIGLLAIGGNSILVMVGEPVPWQDTAGALPFTLAILVVAVVTGGGLGVWLCTSPRRRLAIARRLHALTILTSLGLLAWSATALAFLLPFVDDSTSLNGLARPVELAITRGVTAGAAVFALGGSCVLLTSTRIADELSDRVFGLNRRSCWTCGYPRRSDVCPECGDDRRSSVHDLPRAPGPRAPR